MRQETLVSLACAVLGVCIQINCYLNFHQFLAIPVIFSALLGSSGLVLFERRKK